MSELPYRMTVTALKIERDRLRKILTRLQHSKYQLARLRQTRDRLAKVETELHRRKLRASVD